MISSPTCSFKEFLEEAKLPKSFEIELNGEQITIIRDHHVMQKRGSSPMPRDGGMSKNKYKTILSLGIPQIDTDKTFSISWENNGKNNVISGDYSEDKIVIFGAILKSPKPHEKLYVKATNRTHLGSIQF